MNGQQPETGEDVENVRRLIAFIGIFLLLASQILVFSNPVVDGVVFPGYIWLSIFGVVILILSKVFRPTPFWQKLSARFAFRERVFWILIAALLSVLATWASAVFPTFTRITYIPVTTLWFLSAVSYVYALSKGIFSPQSLMDWIRNHRDEIIIVVVVTLLAAVLRFYKLGAIPRILDGDEGLIGLTAQNTVSGAFANPFALWENFGALYLQAINLSFRFFGTTPFALRLLPAIGGTLAVPSIYLLARQISGRRIALIAAFLVAISQTHIHFSRIVSVAYIQETWLIPLALYFFISGLEKRQSWRAALGGVLLAADFSVYLTAQVIFALALAYMLVAFLFYRTWFAPRFRQMMFFWGGFLITILPEAFYILKNPSNFLNRISQDGVFQSGWLADTMKITGQNAVQILFERVVHAFLSLIYYPAFDFYGSPVPPLGMISGALFLAGLGLALWRVRDPGYLLLNGYFWAATLSVGLFAIPPSADSYRMLMALPAALIMASLGLDQILELLGLGWKNARNAYMFSATAILVSLMIFNLWTYYGDFAGRCRFGGNLVGRFASYLGSYANTIDNELPVYLLSNDQYFYGSHASTDFLSQGRPIINFPGPIDELNPVSGETIIASPDRIPELASWARANPGGQLKYQYDCQTTILLAYQVP
ncbi:MAG: glycosyltransferase family 39 protein [Chloroflexi bacterium]|nr:glycosyltransferase family 39 protein [Chloroflexota bacterium]